MKPLHFPTERTIRAKEKPQETPSHLLGFAVFIREEKVSGPGKQRCQDPFQGRKTSREKDPDTNGTDFSLNIPSFQAFGLSRAAWLTGRKNKGVRTLFGFEKGPDTFVFSYRIEHDLRVPDAIDAVLVETDIGFGFFVLRNKFQVMEGGENRKSTITAGTLCRSIYDVFFPELVRGSSKKITDPAHDN